MALKSGRWTTLDHVTMLPNVNRGHRRAAVCTLDRCSVLIAKQHLHLTSQLEMLKLSVIYVPPMWPQAARLLRSWVRIPPGHGYLSVVSVVCCQVEVSATSLSLVQRSPTDCAASLCVI